MLPFLKIAITGPKDTTPIARILPTEVECFHDDPYDEGQCEITMKSGQSYTTLYTADMFESMLAHYYQQLQKMAQQAQSSNGIIKLQ